MKFNDLRHFLTVSEEIGELEYVKGADWNLEVGIATALVGRQKEPRCLLFDEIRDYPNGYRIATNLYSSAKRSRLVYGMPDDIQTPSELLEAWKEKVKHYVPFAPIKVGSGAVQENAMVGDEVDILRMPAAKWHELDGGRYFCAVVAILKDPEEDWINLGSYRIQVHDKKTLGLNAAQGHHGAMIRDKYWAKGENCPIAICLGQEPSLLVAAGAYEPWSKCEYDYAGWLRGSPVEIVEGEYTGLPIPANAEAVVEGEIPPLEVEARKEGPFGEFPGYYSAEDPLFPVIRVKAIHFRDNPIITGAPPYRGTRRESIPVREVATLLAFEREGIPGVLDVRNIDPFVVIRVRQQYPGHAMRIAQFFMAGIQARPPRYLVLVDEDVDLRSPEEVMWAINTRSDPAESIHIIRGRWGSNNDPRVPPEKRRMSDYSMSSAVIDACRPFSWKGAFPPSVTISSLNKGNVEAKWPFLFNNLGTT